jgi:hypothetical protein
MAAVSPLFGLLVEVHVSGGDIVCDLEENLH